MFKKFSAALVAAFFVLSPAIAQTPNLTGNEFQTQTAGKAVPGTVPMCFNAASQAIPCGSSGAIPSTVSIQDGKAVAATPLTSTGTLISVPDTTGYASIDVQITSAGVGATNTYQQSADGITWSSVSCFPPNATAATAPVTTSSTVGELICPLFSKQFRVQTTSFVSGTVNGLATLRFQPVPKQGVQVGISTSAASVGGFDTGVALATCTGSPCVANSSHAAGTSVGGLYTMATNRTAGLGAWLTSLQYISLGGNTGSYVLRAWTRTPSGTCTDNTAYAGNAADDQYLIPGTPVLISPAAPASTVGDARTYAALTGLTWDVKNQDSAVTVNTYFCLVTTATDTLDQNTSPKLIGSALQN